MVCIIGLQYRKLTLFYFRLRYPFKLFNFLVSSVPLAL